MGRLRAMGRTALDFIWPEGVFCLSCQMLSRGEALCPACQKELHRLCLDTEEDDESVFFRAAWRHDGPARTLVLRLKHRNEAAAARVLAQGMAQAARRMALPPGTVLTWVPMPTRRQRMRGIDHGFCLASALGKELGLPVRPLLRRTRSTAIQARLDRQQRRTNLLHAFGALEAIDFPVLLVDDVYTTGATANACTEALLAAGAPWVKVITATQAMGRGEGEPVKRQWKIEDHIDTF